MKRAQAALEFLTTYGWAFLVILIMIGALAYFGVLNPKALLPSRCTFGPEIDCKEAQVTGTALEFRASNNVGDTADFNFTNVTYLGGQNPSVSCNNFAEVLPGRVMAITCNFTSTSFATGNKAKFDVSGSYKKTDGMYTYPFRGEIYLEIKE